MILTIEKLKSLSPCNEGFKWYLENIKTEDLKEILFQVDAYNPSWARWLFSNLMTKNQRVEIAIFSAELVLHIFENKYPNDSRPKKAIEAAKEYLKTGVKNTDDADAAYAAYVAADAAYAAVYAADAAADAAYAAYVAADAAYAAVYAADAADAADAAADAAYAAVYAADAAADAADAADAAARTGIIGAREKILTEAARILDKGEL